MVVVPYRAPEQEGADQCDQCTARGLELGRASTLGEGLADDGEAKEDQDEREPDMGQRKDGAVSNAFTQLARLAEVVGHQHCLAVSRHQRVHGAK